MNERARQLRKNLTDTERALWKLLRERQMHGFKFRRQAPLGRYVVDFVCFEAKLVIEVDGGQHAQRMATDEWRTAWLHSQGFEVLRFWDNEVLGTLDGVLAVISAHLTPHLNPPPQGGRKTPSTHTISS